MKIYTYYDKIGFNLQDELLEIWKASWAIHGFEPVVLSRSDAQKSPFFQRYYDFVQRVHEKSVNQILPEYGYWMASQLEIIGFHTIEEPAYMSDYDMINNGFLMGESLNSTVHWYNDACSCFASGDKQGWEKYIHFLFDCESTIVDWCKNEYFNTGRKAFGDQDFLIAVRDIGLDYNIYTMSRNLDIIGSNYIPDQINVCKIPHLSHSNMQAIKQQHAQYANYSQDEIRIIFALEILNRHVTKL